MTNYSVSEFATFQPFRATLWNKQVGSYKDIHSGKTNYFFIVFLEITNGKPFTVSGNPASQDVMQAVNSLEKGRDYTFPNALRNGATN